jgi:hypothetical protein
VQLKVRSSLWKVPDAQSLQLASNEPSAAGTYWHCSGLVSGADFEQRLCSAHGVHSVTTPTTEKELKAHASILSAPGQRAPGSHSAQTKDGPS